MKPVTRVEQHFAKLAGEYDGEMPEPITREEIYLSYLNGNTNISLPEPITRAERYLYELCVSGSGGGDRRRYTRAKTGKEKLMLPSEMPGEIESIALGDIAERDAEWINRTIESVVFPSGVTTLKAYVFRGCTHLVSVELSAEITGIGDIHAMG